MRGICLVCLLFGLLNPLFGAWVMFSDGEDTYIYNNANGDIFVRNRAGGENYEDKFIKMPAGIIPNAAQNDAKPTKQSDSSDSKNAKDSAKSDSQNADSKATQEQLQALERRFQELESNLLNKALE